MGDFGERMEEGRRIACALVRSVIENPETGPDKAAELAHLHLVFEDGDMTGLVVGFVRLADGLLHGLSDATGTPPLELLRQYEPEPEA